MPETNLSKKYSGELDYGDRKTVSQYFEQTGFESQIYEFEDKAVLKAGDSGLSKVFFDLFGFPIKQFEVTFYKPEDRDEVRYFSERSEYQLEHFLEEAEDLMD